MCKNFFVVICGFHGEANIGPFVFPFATSTIIPQNTVRDYFISPLSMTGIHLKEKDGNWYIYL